VKGAPSALGQNLGLVLETVQNNNYVVTAISISKKKRFPKVSKPHKTVDALTYRDLLWKSRFTQIKVFQKEILNFTEAPQSNDSILRFAGGTVLVKKVKFPKSNPRPVFLPKSPSNPMATRTIGRDRFSCFRLTAQLLWTLLPKASQRSCLRK
jgi:hypothetical protein